MSRLDEVKALSPMARLLYWIQERENVRLRRATGADKPWTADPILQQYRFCNVRRMDDRVSQWLLRNWYTPHRDHPNMLHAVALARFVNLPESLEYVTPHVFGRPKGYPVDWEWVKTSLRDRYNYGAVFNGAYMVRGNTTKSPDKIGTVVDEYIGALVAADLQFDRKYMEPVHEALTGVYGFGSFMAGQIVADLRWALTGEWRDRLRWAPAGPGSIRGLNRIYGYGLKSGMTQPTFMLHFRPVMDQLRSSLPESLTRKLEAHDYQNCLCEFDKWERALWGEGTPKSRYPGDK